MVKTLNLQWRKCRVRKRCAPGAGVIARRVTFERVDDGVQFPHPTDTGVAQVPDQPQLATGLEYPGDFRQRFGAGEPVKRLRANHHIHRSIRQRQISRRATHRQDLRPRVRELLQHLRHRFHGNHLGAGRHKPPGELAGAGAQIEHGFMPIQTQRRGQPLTDLRRIVRPPFDVGVGSAFVAGSG